MMNPQHQLLSDLFDGDPIYDQEYHQDYREDFWTPYTRAGFILPSLLFIIVAVYHFLCILDYDLLPLPELLWNTLVYATPSRLLDAIEAYTNPLRISNPNLKRLPRTHAAKSESMRRILGLDVPGGIIGTVTQAGRRRLSTLPGISMVQGGDGQPPGLGNWDNSCYQNSVLQGLASLDSLSEYLTKPLIEGDSAGGVSNPDMKMAEALRGLIETLKDPSNNGRRIWTPATLKSMSSWQQQDAQEYFSKVLDEIDKEVGKMADSMRKSLGLESDRTSTSSPKNPEALPLSTFRNPLEGLIAQRVGCTRCGYSEGLSMIPFNCLTVPLGRAWEYNISECLDEYTKLEPIEGVECGKCTLLKTHRLLSTILERVKDSPEDSTVRRSTTERLAAVTSALEDDDYEDKTLLQKCKIPSKSRVSSTKSRQAVIARPPRSLVVHFNRSLFDELTGELKKNYSEVRFPKTLDLGPWCLGSTGTKEQSGTEQWLLNPDESMIASDVKASRLQGPLYELRAVVTHYGRHENGHYICYRKHPVNAVDEKVVAKQQWWRLSDDDVMKVSEENVLGQGGVFMLFFDCIEPAIPLSAKENIQEDAASAQPIPSAEMTLKDSIILPTTKHAKPSDVEAVHKGATLAANVPLPITEDRDLSDTEAQGIFLASRGESVATSISEYGDEDTDENEQQEYSPAKAILVPTYIQASDIHKEGENPEQQRIVSSANLLMV